MTGPIPIQSVNISPQFVQTQKNTGLEMLMTALQHRKELDIAKQKLQQDQQQFELSKRLGDSSIQRSDAETARIKSELKDRELNHAAADVAEQILQGNLIRLSSSTAMATVIANNPSLKDERVAREFWTRAQTYLGVMNTIKPDNQLVQSGNGNFVAIDRKNPGAGGVDTRVPVPATTTTLRVAPALERRIRLGAKNASQAIRQAVALVARDPNANFKPVLSDIAGSAAESRLADWVPGIKGAAGYARRKTMSANQQKFQNLLNIVAHNAVGLLPGTRQSIVLFNNLRDSYSTDAGDAPELRAQKLALLTDLGVSLNALSRGEDASLAHLPGFEDFAQLGLPESPTESAPLQPDSVSGGTVTPVRSRYHPKFQRP